MAQGTQPNVFNEQNNSYVQMTNKQKMTIIVGESFNDDYSEFIVDATNRVGNYIVEDALNEMSCQGINSSILVDGETPEIAEIGYNEKYSCNFIYKIREDELRNASNTQEDLDKLYNKIYTNLDEQERKNNWRQFPQLLSETTGLKDDQLVYGTDISQYAGLLKAMRSDITNLKTPTDKYNAYTKTIDGKTHTLKTFSTRPYIFIRNDLLDAIQIDYEAGVRNLEKIAIDAKIIKVPTFYKLNPDFNNNQPVSDANPKFIEDPTKLWLTCGEGYVKIFKHFEKRAKLEDVRSFNIGKAVTYIKYLSKLVPAIWHLSGEKPEARSK